jgi:hypothetical protein
MSLEHRERQKWCEEVSRINDTINSSEPSVSLDDI